MERRLQANVSEYDRGRLTRRQLMTQLSGLIAMSGAASVFAGEKQRPPSTFTAIGLNHIALNITDLRRSRDFYIKHLGLEVARESSDSCFLRFGSNFVALFRGAPPGLNHYCYSIEDFSVETAGDRLRKQGIEPRIQGDRIYFDDPDGLEVQLSSPDHRV